MSIRGKFKNGVIVLDSQPTWPEGSVVEVRFAPSGRNSALDPHASLATALAHPVSTGISDLAANLDHYLYGEPKAGNAG